MGKKIAMLLLGLLVIAGCSQSKAPQGSYTDVSAVEIRFSSVPETVQAQTSATLKATIEGVGQLSEMQVSFEIFPLRGGKSEYIDAVYTRNGVFTAEKKFKEAGNYRIDVHLYTPDGSHIERKNELQVS